MTIVDGKKIAAEVLEKLKKEIQGRDIKLRLAVVLVSNNQGLKKFVELKDKAARKIGAEFALFDFPETISEDQLKKEVRKIVQDDANKGALVELPLPKEINTRSILNEISLEKDVDVLSQKAQDGFYSNNSMILPPAVEAVKTVLEFYKFDLKGPDTKGIEDPRFVSSDIRQRTNRDKKAAVFGYGLLVGKPVAYWLLQNGAKVSVIDEYTKDPRKYSIEADIVISGVGRPELIDGEMVKDGVAAIDFGYENKEGRMVGDFKFDEVASKASLVTPVPGGIGPVVVASVIKNLVRLNS